MTARFVPVATGVTLKTILTRQRLGGVTDTRNVVNESLLLM